MFWIDLVFAIIFATVFSIILSLGAGWRHPARRESTGTATLFLFLTLMFLLWAGSVWLPAWGPLWLGRPWMSLLIVGLLISLLLMAIAAPVRRPPRSNREAKKQAEEMAEEEAEIGAVFGLFFWILIGGLFIAALARYIR